MDAQNNKQQLNSERNELNVLIEKGVEFQMEVVEVTTQKKLWGLFKKRVKTKAVKTFKIEEPTLSTLDRLSNEWIKLAISEEELKGDDALIAAKNLAVEHSQTCAKIIALAVLGTDYLIPKTNGGYNYDTKKLTELTRIFYTFLKPSELYKLTVLINAMSNLGDFTNSIRLMSAQRTTAPIRIEDEQRV